MDDKDVPSTPDWRPASIASADSESTPASSSILSPPETQSDAVSAEQVAVPAADGRYIEPFEASVCARLTDAVRTQRPLAGVLKTAAESVRFHSKWFPEPALNGLLQAAIDAATSSSSSADLYGTLTLIDTVGTYAVLPFSAVVPAVRFISYTHYQGTRMHKYKRLAKEAWKSVQQLLDSHLRAQCLAALVYVLDYGHGNTTEGAGAATGAIRILTEKLLKKKHRSALPAVPLIRLLRSCQGALARRSDVLREQVVRALEIVLSEPYLLAELDRDAGWDTCLDCIKRCVASEDKQYLGPLLDRLLDNEARLQPHQLATVVQIFLDVERPLSPMMASILFAPWSVSKMLSASDSPPEFQHLLERLSTSSTYVSELASLTARDINSTLCSSGPQRVSNSLERYLTLAASSTTTTSAATVCCEAITRCFIGSLNQTTYDGSAEWKVALSFDALCAIAARAYHMEARLAALKALVCVRADIAGAVYLTPSVRGQMFLPERPSDKVSLSVTGIGQSSSSTLPRAAWEKLMLDLMGDADYECYSFLLDQLPRQLTNHTLFASSAAFIKSLRAAACTTVDLPSRQGADKSHDTIRLIQMLTTLIGYRRVFSKADLNEIVDAFLRTAGARDFHVSIHCVHALTVCCYELPDIVTSQLDSIIGRMSKMVSQRHVAIHVLEFLAGLSRLPELYRNFRQDDFKRIFGVCLSYLQSLRDTSSQPERMQTPASEQSSIKSAETPEDLPQYVYALAHHVITFWYINLRPDDRPDIKRYIANSLRYSKLDGTETIEDHGLVILDMMDRVDTGHGFTVPDGGTFAPQDGRLLVRNRISGLLLVTTHTSLRSGKTLVTVRRPSATTYCVVRGSTRRLPGSRCEAKVTAEGGLSGVMPILPDDRSDAVYGLIAIPAESSLLDSRDIVTLPDDETVKRAIQSFDRVSGLDSHKAGVMYIGEGQQNETDILLNSSGSPDYREFVHGLGTIRRLKEATFNTQGLDKYGDADGEHAIVWHNEVTELVFHVTTMMPTTDDVQLTTMNKKRHIGNDYVNIIFNNSGKAFNLKTFPSQFDYVYIVITPSARTTFLQTRTHTMNTSADERFYKVELLTRDGIPAISSAAEAKIISGMSLPAYVRNLALNACVFSLVWQSKDSGEYPSSWRLRLQQLQSLRRRYAAQGRRRG